MKNALITVSVLAAALFVANNLPATMAEKESSVKAGCPFRPKPKGCPFRPKPKKSEKKCPCESKPRK